VEAVWSDGNLDLLGQLYAADIVRHSPPFPDVVGLEAYRQTIAAIRESFPDFQMTVDEVIVDGDRVVTRWHWTGTHTGDAPISGIPATGRSVTMTGATVCHNGEDGKTFEEWMFGDWLGELQQLGVIPRMGGGRE
jgi:steroid delta-isomerase-like uncharacterized protein